MRISRKVAVVYLLTLLPLFALGLGLLYQWYSAHLTVIENDRLNNARLVATAFETFARDLSGASKALAEATLDNPPPAPSPSRFQLMAASFPLHFTAVLDHEGRVVYASDPGLTGRLIQDPAIDDARAGAGLAIGNSREFDGRVGFFLAQGVSASEGGSTGTSVQFVDPVRLTRRLTRNPLSAGGASIVDASGTLVVAFERPEIGLEQQYWGDEPPVAAALSGAEYVGRDWVFPLTGEHRVVAAVPIGRLEWVATSAVPLEDALGPFWESLSFAVGIGMLTLIVSGTAAGLMARSLLDSITALREQSMTVGDRDRHPGDLVTSGDEIEDVSRVLRQTDAELRSYITGLEAIGAAGRTLSAAIGEGDVDNAIIRAARELFDAHALWVLLYEGRRDELEIAVWYSANGAASPLQPVRPGRTSAGRVFSEGGVALVGDAEKVDFAWPDTARAAGIEAFAEIPLERAGRAFGVLGLSAAGIEAWVERGREVALLRAFGNEVATVLENARLYENERLIADTLQQSLLTLPDRLPGITFAASYHAATQTARVGGDFYDLFELEDRIGIVIGDVAGHGLDAAVLTSLVKNAVRAHADEPGKTPADVVALTNELMVKESRPESFVTLFVAILDCATGLLTYCNAGHTTGVILVADGSLVPLSSTSMLVGAFSGVAFEQRTIPLSPNDTLLLYTDGLTEARCQGELFGEKRLMEFVGALRTHVPAEMVEAVFSHVVDYTGGELSDDLALLVVRRTGSATDAEKDAGQAGPPRAPSGANR